MPDLTEPDHEIFPRQFAVNEPANMITLSTDLCIVCPHTREQHYLKEDYFSQCWCRACNLIEMAGPCSYFFIARHQFKPKIIALDECTICRLVADNDAHRP